MFITEVTSLREALAKKKHILQVAGSTLSFSRTKYFKNSATVVQNYMLPLNECEVLEFFLWFSQNHFNISIFLRNRLILEKVFERVFLFFRIEELKFLKVFKFTDASAVNELKHLLRI